MKTLKNHTLLYDEHCPLCSAYTKAFIKTRMLDESGRESFQQKNETTCSILDKDRARNEIALINHETGEVTYGIESLFKIIANAFPFFAPLFRFTPFKWLMKKVYSFISYNRKVIIPSNEKCDFCTPDLNIKYRWVYLVFTWLISSLILTWYSQFLVGLLPKTEFYREFLICGGQILFQSVLINIIAKGKVLNYLGNMMTISFAASLVLLILGGMLSLFAITNPIVYLALFMLVVGAMLLEHLRRMKLLEISLIASAGWVFYRIIVLFIIL